MKKERNVRLFPPIVVNFAVVAILTATAIMSTGSGVNTDAAESTIEEQQTLALTPTAETQITAEQTTDTEQENTYIGTFSRDWDSEDAEILLKIAMAEAEGESTEGKALVMLVVINRAFSGDFPNTIYDVVFQPGQFSVTTDGGRYWTTEPNEDCYKALELLYQG
ncbi:MAG: cell wall hydrolase [Ruminococcus sp.]|nr:cell wall hydrolase [Ruminococcus sp.]